MWRTAMVIKCYLVLIKHINQSFVQLPCATKQILSFAMNLSLALAGQQLISTYGCGFVMLNNQTK